MGRTGGLEELMHPVLAKNVDAVARLIQDLSVQEAQISQHPEIHAWSAQQVVEHLILTFQHSEKLLGEALSKRRPSPYRRTLRQRILKAQFSWFGVMPHGVPALRSLRPYEVVAQSGAELAARFLAEAEKLDHLLTECRKSCGLLPCGIHPIYGSLRVEEWRQYHAVHCRHHLPQLRSAVANASRKADLLPWPVSASQSPEKQRDLSGTAAVSGRS